MKLKQFRSHSSMKGLSYFFLKMTLKNEYRTTNIEFLTRIIGTDKALDHEDNVKAKHRITQVFAHLPI